jgi:hypothetical protein
MPSSSPCMRRTVRMLPCLCCLRDRFVLLSTPRLQVCRSFSVACGYIERLHQFMPRRMRMMGPCRKACEIE